jgi:hypothetical protein
MKYCVRGILWKEEYEADVLGILVNDNGIQYHIKHL